MKKAKTLLVTLASCVMLSGCSILGFELPSFGLKLPEINVPAWLDPLGLFKGKDPGQNGGGTETKEVTISFDNMPSVIGIDEDVDLKSVVKVENATSFTVTLTDASYDFVSISNKVITSFAEGKVEGTVTAGDKTKDFSFDVLSDERMALIDVIGEYKDEYSFLIPYEDSFGLVTWSDKYFFSDEFEDVYDDNGQYTGTRAGGYVEGKDGKIYSYYYNYPTTQTGSPTIQFLKTGNEPVTLDGTFQPIDFIDPLTIPYDEETGAFVITVEDDPTIEAKAEKMLATSFENYVFTFDSIQFYVYLPDEESGLTEPLVQIVFMVLYQGRVLSFNGYVLGDHTKVPYMEAFVEAEGQPTPIVDTKTNFGGAMDAVLAGKNFTVGVSTGFYNDAGSEIENPYGGEEYANLIVHGLGCGQAITFVTENEILQFNPDEPEIIEGAIIHEGKLYNYIYREVNEAPALLAEQVGTAESVFDQAAGTVINYMFTNSDADFWNEIFANDATGNETTLQISFTGSTGKELLSAFGFSALNQSIDKEAITLSHGINTMLNEQYGFYEYFDVTGTLVVQNQQVAVIDFMFDFYLAEDVHYTVEIYIGNIGTTEIPNLGLDITYLN